ncbi:cold shock domain-containing protein E1-like [Liolophura sinensis]|uniref:cold shock domain-containing protein E1-like n=1 Tax=Liolophura sinensis TaxID=3198878 RepID=UPI00315984A9
MTCANGMNSPQWKNFQPPMQDPAILSFQRSSNTMNATLIQQPNSNGIVRETGFVEKLLHSYGFIQCCDREARLFFHFSEYNDSIDNMKIGDPVEFQMSYDRRTGKPVACAVTKVESPLIDVEVLSEEKYKGTIVQEAKPLKNKNGSLPQTVDGLGRVTYEHNGECFFLPYGVEDIVDSSVKLKAGDQVNFSISTDKRNGNIRARQLDGVSSPQSERHQGVVCSMKESFGFIERADVVREIFFHYSEFKGNINELLLGDDVEFNVQTRNGKEVAVNIIRLAEGTVIFEDIALDRIKGTVLKTLKGANSRRQSDPLAGRIGYTTAKGLVEIPYGDKDQIGDFTLLTGDVVEFNIATDRRDKLQRATHIELLDETFVTSSEKRDTGVVSSLKEGFGFIQCTDRDARMFFHFSELMDSSREITLQDELEFTVVQDPTNRQIAIRIKYLPKGSVSFLNVLPLKYIGTVDREPATHKSPTKNKESDIGNIVFDYEGAIENIPYHLKDVVDPKCLPRYGDKVDFQIAEQKRNKAKIAVNIKVVLRNTATKCYGFIATLKENYGFIENSEHDKEVFFHFSAYDGDASELDLGDEVEYTLTRKSAKISAENIRRVTKGTVAPEEIQRDKGILQGKIIRPMRIVNPEQEEYAGLVQVGFDDDVKTTYTYGITSLADKRDFLQQGDVVKFQLAMVKSNGKVRAVNIAATRKYIRAKVDSVKGQFGFINYEAEEGKKLFFHMTEVHDGADIQIGDEVEFVVVQNQRNGKYSACSLRKLTDQRRPERLLSRLKSMNDDPTGPKLTVLRQPKGPDGSKGFAKRVLWNRSS